MIEVLEKSLKRTLGLKKDQIPGDPYDVIPVKDRKYAKETVEVYMGRRRIQQLVNFEYFPNLEVVWLNDNNLTSVEGLDKNFRVKENLGSEPETIIIISRLFFRNKLCIKF